MICREEDPRVKILKERLLKFYSESTDYDAFKADGEQPLFWNILRNAIGNRVRDKGTCSVLEFGAGRTGFGRSLGELRPSVSFAVQDVTAINRQHLSNEADEVYIGDLREISGKFDVIFSCFVFEHVTEPKQTLDHLLKLLNSDGSLFLLCPRYDFPFYLSPALKHLSKTRQRLIGMWLQWRRLMVLVTGKPDFLLVTDPAVFHGDWFMDSDAVHLVSLADIKAYLRNRYRLTKHILGFQGIVGELWERLCLLSIEITVEPAVTPPTGR